MLSLRPVLRRQLCPLNGLVNRPAAAAGIWNGAIIPPPTSTRIWKKGAVPSRLVSVEFASAIAAPPTTAGSSNGAPNRLFFIGTHFTRRFFTTETNPTHLPLSHQIWEYTKKWFRRVTLVKVLILLGCFSVAFYLFSSEDNIKNMISAFEKGEITGFIPLSSEVKVERKHLVQNIKAFLHPTSLETFSVIVGETGTGKSTAIRDAVSQLEYPRGVVYFMAPEDTSAFPSELAEAVGYNPNALDLLGGLRRWLSHRTQEDTISEWTQLKRALVDTAKAYNSKHGRPPVLIIDAADFIAKDNPKFFGDLMKFAKTLADSGLLHIVFASSEGSTLPLLMDDSSKSRSFFLEVGDITDPEAVDCLVRRGVPEDRAQKAVANITGGRLIEVVRYSIFYERYGQSDEMYRLPYDEMIQYTLDLHALKVDHPLFKELLKGKVGFTKAKSLLCQTDNNESQQRAIKILEDLLRKNILSAHADNSYTFNSRIVLTYFSNSSQMR